jgi:hypothetical protein
MLLSISTLFSLFSHVRVEFSPEVSRHEQEQRGFFWSYFLKTSESYEIEVDSDRLGRAQLALTDQRSWAYFQDYAYVPKLYRNISYTTFQWWDIVCGMALYTYLKWPTLRRYGFAGLSIAGAAVMIGEYVQCQYAPLVLCCYQNEERIPYSLPARYKWLNNEYCDRQTRPFCIDYRLSEGQVVVNIQEVLSVVIKRTEPFSVAHYMSALVHPQHLANIVLGYGVVGFTSYLMRFFNISTQRS